MLSVELFFFFGAATPLSLGIDSGKGKLDWQDGFYGISIARDGAHEKQGMHRTSQHKGRRELFALVCFLLSPML